jgi:MFS family permease
LLASVRNEAGGRVILYMLLAQAAFQIATPYFTPYMLTHLKLSYLGYLVLLCIPFISRSICLPAWGHAVERIGAYHVLWIGGLGVAMLPVLWNVSDSYAYLVAIQIGAGVVWAGYELAQILLFFDTIPTERRMGVLTVYNVFNSLGFFVGSLLGAAMLTMLGADRHAYYLLFASSTVVRIATVLVLVRRPARAARPQPQSIPATPWSHVMELPAVQLGIRRDGPHALPNPSPIPKLSPVPVPCVVSPGIQKSVAAKR